DSPPVGLGVENFLDESDALVVEDRLGLAGVDDDEALKSFETQEVSMDRSVRNRCRGTGSPGTSWLGGRPYTCSGAGGIITRGAVVREEEAESIACDFSVAGEKDDDSVLGVVGDSLTEPGKCCVEGVRGDLAASEVQIQSGAGRRVGAAGLMPAQEFRQAA